MIKKNNSRIKKYLLALGVFLLPISVFAEPTCEVDPFITSMYQGDTANMTVVLTTTDPKAPFEVDLGSLPTAVESGFLKKESIETTGNIKKIPLVVQTKRDAQLGSFMIAVVYKTSQSDQFVCQFNLEVKKKISTGTALVIQNTAKNVSSGILPVSMKLTAVSTSTIEMTATTTSASSTAIRKVFTKRLSLRSTDTEVRSLQKVLKSLAFFPKNESITGYFGPITENAVREFQKSRSIEQIGIVGPKTRKSLEEIVKVSR